MSREARRFVALALVMGGAFCLLGAAQPAKAQPLLHDYLPDEFQAQVNARDKLLREILPPPPGPLSFFIDQTKTWNPGAVVRVAFHGGNEALYYRIAEVAKIWSQHANLRFDFQDENGFRTFSPLDTEYRAEIRISFCREGYWSAIGIDATDPMVFQPGEPTMSLGGFADRLPATWEATTLHELGHAIGFLHEHQQPGSPCSSAFLWEDDSSYQRTTDPSGRYIPDDQGRRPGIYTVLSGPPNRWTRDKVQRNLVEMPEARAYRTGPFDKFSIMKYWFPPWMFRNGTSSPCYAEPNVKLSPQDKEGAAWAYPRSPAAIVEALRIRLSFYKTAVAAPDLPIELRNAYIKRLQELEQALDALSR